MKKIAAIFDMDGTLIDNNKYLFEAYVKLFEKHHFPKLTREVFNKQLSGVPGVQALKNVLGDKQKGADFEALYNEKNEIYKKAYAAHVRPIKGLETFLASLEKAGVKISLASSATPANVDFIFSHLNIRQYFDKLIDNEHLKKGKPNPEIFLTAAEKLKMPAEDCVVFEDSISGVEAANNAKMKVVALTTTHKAGELKPVDLVIDDYTDITADKLFALFE